MSVSSPINRLAPLMKSFPVVAGKGSEPEEYAGSDASKANVSRKVDASVSATASVTYVTNKSTNKEEEEFGGRCTISTGTSPPPQNMSTQVIYFFLSSQ